MTQAMRAQRLLAAAHVPADVIKADTGSGGRGCTYALSFSCTQKENVRMLLSSKGIRVKALTEARDDGLS
jgi:hypothetical protein